MKVLQNLTITGEAKNISDWLDELEANPAPWRINPVFREKWLKDPSHRQPRSATFDAPETTSFADASVFLFVRNEGTECALLNTITKYRMPVDYYNAAITAFYRDCVAPHLSRFALNALLTRDEEFVEDTLSPENLRLLETFADFANKHTGTSYPADNERWQEFTAASAKSKQIISHKLLQDWLEERKFPPSVAFELAEEYKRYIEFSRRYDAAERAQEYVHA